MPVKLLADNKPISYKEFDENFTELYPVGSIFMTTRHTTKTELETALGFGVWEKFGPGRAIIGVETDDRNGSYRHPNDQIGFTNPRTNSSFETGKLRIIRGADGGNNFWIVGGFLSVQISDIDATYNPNQNDQSTFPDAYTYGLTSEALTEGQIITITGLGTQTDTSLGRSVSLDGTYLITSKTGVDTQLKKIDTTLDTLASDHYNYYDYDTPANHTGFSATGVTYKLFAAGEEKGGRINHVVTESEMPSHDHALNYANRALNTMDTTDDEGERGGGGQLQISANPAGGSGEAHNNRQPARQVYMYKRIS